MRRFRPIIRPIARLSGDLLGLVPALLAGAGVFLIVAGLFYYLQPVAAESSATASAGPSEPIAVYSLPPRVSPGPSGSATIQEAIATRIEVPALGIDLPVVTSPPNEQFPLCNVAEYLSLDKIFAYPGLPQTTYLYAHAQKGMFLPLLTASKTNNGAAMIGMWAEVYTDDNQRHIYEITQVIRGVPANASSLDRPLNVTTDQLWLQTSEGPLESSTKLQVVAQPIGVLAASQADAHPTGKGNVCPTAPKCKTAGASGCRP
jgi:sortase (surface protein transpeptidase)